MGYTAVMSNVSYNQLQKLTGFSYPTIKKRTFELDPTGTGPSNANLFDSKKALPLIYAPMFKKKIQEADDTSSAGLTAERALLAKQQRIGQEIKNAKERRELIPMSEITGTWIRIVAGAKKQFMSLPGRLTQLIKTAKSDAEIRLIMENEINTILENLSKGIE